MAMTHDPKNPGPCDVIDLCPICGGSMEAVYSRAHQKVCVCSDCHTSITVPSAAWDVMRGKGDRGR
jgi:hypothetical protein